VLNYFRNHSKKTKLMNKAELIDAIASEAGLSKADAKKALDAFVGATVGAMKKGDRVSLVGFGSFSVSKREARTGRNPQTGKEIKIAAKNVVRFKAGVELSGAVN
jgi:DNA-binding protein HU-beta